MSFPGLSSSLQSRGAQDQGSRSGAGPSSCITVCMSLVLPLSPRRPVRHEPSLPPLCSTELLIGIVVIHVRFLKILS